MANCWVEKKQFCRQYLDVGLAAHGGIKVLYLFAKILARRVLGEGVANWPKTMCSVFDIFPWTMLFLLVSYNQKNIFECDCMFTHVHIFIKGQGTLCQYLIDIADSCHT